MKRKITLLIDVEVLELIDEVAKRRLGVGRNAFLALAGVSAALPFASIIPRPKRRQSLEKLEAFLTEVRGQIEKAI